MSLTLWRALKSTFHCPGWVQLTGVTPSSKINVDAWLAELRRLAAEADEPFLPEGRPEQPPMPDDDIDLDREWGGEEK